MQISFLKKSNYESDKKIRVKNKKDSESNTGLHTEDDILVLEADDVTNLTQESFLFEADQSLLYKNSKGVKILITKEKQERADEILLDNDTGHDHLVFPDEGLIVKNDKVIINNSKTVGENIEVLEQDYETRNVCVELVDSYNVSSWKDHKKMVKEKCDKTIDEGDELHIHHDGCYLLLKKGYREAVRLEAQGGLNLPNILEFIGVDVSNSDIKEIVK